MLPSFPSRCAAHSPPTHTTARNRMGLDALFQSAPSPFPPHIPLPSTSRASVAIVLRVTPSSSTSTHHHDLGRFRAWYFSKSNSPPPETEVLFIRRAINPKDRWSGQIAFPGGRHAEGEGDLDCVCREVKEELGLELGRGGRFCLLGQLQDRAMKRTTRSLVVSTFVFLLLDYSAPVEFVLAEREVADAFWVPASVLTGEASRLGQLTLQLASLRIPSKPLRMSRLLGVRTLSFPCLYLRGGTADPECALWGLTLGIVSDLLELASLPNLKHRRQTELAPLPLSQTTIPFLTNSRPANVLLEAYYTRRLSGEAWLWVVVGVLGAAAAVCSLSVRIHHGAASTSTSRL